MSAPTRVVALAEVRIGDVTPFGLRVVDIQTVEAAWPHDAYYVIRFDRGDTIEGHGDTTLTIDATEATDNDSA